MQEILQYKQYKQLIEISKSTSSIDALSFSQKKYKVMYIILYKHMTVHDMYILVLLSHHIELKMLTFIDVCSLSPLFNLGEAFSFGC